MEFTNNDTHINVKDLESSPISKYENSDTEDAILPQVAGDTTSKKEVFPVVYAVLSNHLVTALSESSINQVLQENGVSRNSGKGPIYISGTWQNVLAVKATLEKKVNDFNESQPASKSDTRNTQSEFVYSASNPSELHVVIHFSNPEEKVIKTENDIHQDNQIISKTDESVSKNYVNSQSNLIESHTAVNTSPNGGRGKVKKIDRSQVIKTLLRLEKDNKTHVPKLLEPRLNVPQPNLEQFNGFVVNPNKGQSNKLTYKHPELAKDVCDLCGYRSSREGVIRHKQRRHPKHVYHCAVCKSKFGVKYDMRRHRMNHFDRRGRLTLKGRRVFVEHNPGEDPNAITLAKFEENFQGDEAISTEDINEDTCELVITDACIPDDEQPQPEPVTITVKEEKVAHSEGRGSSKNSQQAKTKYKYPPKDTSKTTCDICNKVFPVRCLSVHMKIHAQKELLRCTHAPNCSFQTYERGRLNEHIRLKHLKLWHCDECTASFHTRSALETHIEGVHGENMQCQVCLKTVSTQRYLAVHMQREHQDLKRHFCPTCKKGFYDKNEMIIHSAAHMGPNDEFPGKMFTCAYCPKRFSRKSILRQHENTHTGNKPYQCDQCTKSFSYSAQLHKHKKVHSDERKHQCRHCMRSFKFPYKLAQHMIMHTGDPKHKCQDCGKCFTTYSTLKTHACKAFGTGNVLHRRYQPPIIATSTQQTLEESCTNDTTKKNTLFMCGFCEELFKTFDEVNAHVQTHASEAVQESDLSELGLSEIQEETSTTLETLVMSDDIHVDEGLGHGESGEQVLDHIGEKVEITEQVFVDGQIQEIMDVSHAVLQTVDNVRIIHEKPADNGHGLRQNEGDRFIVAQPIHCEQIIRQADNTAACLQTVEQVMITGSVSGRPGSEENMLIKKESIGEHISLQTIDNIPTGGYVIDSEDTSQESIQGMDNSGQVMEYIIDNGQIVEYIENKTEH